MTDKMGMASMTTANPLVTRAIKATTGILPTATTPNRVSMLRRLRLCQVMPTSALQCRVLDITGSMDIGTSSADGIPGRQAIGCVPRIQAGIG